MPERAKVAAVVLAAGSSTRMGRNKLLLDLGGETLVRRAVRAAVGRRRGPGGRRPRPRGAARAGRAGGPALRGRREPRSRGGRRHVGADGRAAGAGGRGRARGRAGRHAVRDRGDDRDAGRSATATTRRAAGRLALRRRAGAAHPLRPRAVRGAAPDPRRALREAGRPAPRAARRRSWPGRRARCATSTCPRTTTASAPSWRGAEPMRRELLDLASDLARRGEPFALATVVARKPPISAQVGDMALVTREAPSTAGSAGAARGRPSPPRPAGRSRTASPGWSSLDPDPESQRRPGLTVFPMTCHSGGSVEIHIQPVLPAPRLLVYGVSPTARALARLAKAMGYAVCAVDPDRGRVRVSRRGRRGHGSRRRSRRRDVGARLRGGGDAGAVGRGRARSRPLAHEPDYLGVVASPKRFGEMRALLAGKVPEAVLARIKNPAGLDLGARLPEEIALSILAEIVKEQRAAPRRRPRRAPSAGRAARGPRPRLRHDRAGGRTRATARSTRAATSSSARRAAASGSWPRRSATSPWPRRREAGDPGAARRAGARGLHRRARDRHRRVPGPRDAQAAARRGRRRGGQDGAGQGPGPTARAPS